jgi:hypothetical protein
LAAAVLLEMILLVLLAIILYLAPLHPLEAAAAAEVTLRRLLAATEVLAAAVDTVSLAATETRRVHHHLKVTMVVRALIICQVCFLLEAAAAVPLLLVSRQAPELVAMVATAPRQALAVHQSLTLAVVAVLITLLEQTPGVLVVLAVAVMAAASAQAVRLPSPAQRILAAAVAALAPTDKPRVVQAAPVSSSSNTLSPSNLS